MMESLKIARALGVGAVLLALAVVPASAASASTTVVVPTQVTAQAPIVAGPSRSECAFLNFPDTSLAALQTAVNSFQSETDSTLSCLSAYLTGEPTWADWETPWITQSQFGYAPWVAEAPQSRQLVLQVDLIPANLEDVSDPLSWEQSCAAGAFDLHATALGENLVAAGLQNTVIRLGAEMNGTWEADFIGTTTQEQSAWAACFANEVTALRQASGQNFLIDWDTNACKGAYPYANYYPGNAYVDIVGLDLYDVDCTTPNSSVTFPQLNSEVYGLADFEAFAAAQGKPMSFPEWGLSTVPAGDDPAYIDGMASAVASKNFAFESYFGGSSDPNSKAEGLSSSTPLSLDAYQEWFGASPPTAGSISGVVTAVGGGDLAGICVDAFLDGTDIAASATTAADGTYTIPGLAPGSYGVFFVPGCGGGDYATQWYNDTPTGTQSAPGTLISVSASPTTGVDAVMPAGTSISGTIRAAVGGGDLAGVCVSAFPVGGTSSAGTPGVSATDGTYRVEGVVPGDYDVEFLAGPCGGNYVPQWYNDTPTGASLISQAVAVTVGSPATNVNAAMAVGASISGTVTGAVNGSDVANVCVSLASTDGGGGGSTTSSADGVYTVSGVAAGPYDVVVDPTCGGTRTSAYASPQPTSGA
ncbi:MAG: hypothetical protein JWM55_546, partial [Acidimicrobiaceae bacterium]|nr:hypothetical protein [Acidimicrobiaceae bacterium]